MKASYFVRVELGSDLVVDQFFEELEDALDNFIVLVECVQSSLHAKLEMVRIEPFPESIEVLA